LYGVEYDPQTLKLSLLETGEGKIGTTLDRVLLFCFHYDATSGRYGPVAIRLMQIAGGITLGILLIGLVPTWLRRHHATGRTSAEEASTTVVGGGANRPEATNGTPEANGLTSLPEEH
jgi:protein SCO1/2